MAHRQLNVSRGKLFTTLLIVAVALQLAPHRYTTRLNILFLRAFHPILNIGLPGFSHIFRPSSSTEATVRDSEYDRLYITYKNTCAALKTLQDKYDTLSGLRGGLPKLGAALPLARVITPAINSFAHEIIINGGEGAGFKPGQLVLAWNKSSLVGSPMESVVIGSVSEVREATATVRLLTDSKHTLMVGVWREGKPAPTIERQMVGDGKAACRIPGISRQCDIRVGDTVFASPERGLLDIPVVIGEVAVVEHDRNQPLLWEITVRPIFDRDALADVAVIVMNPKETDKP